MNRHSPPAVASFEHIFLMCLLGFTALNAIGGGIYGLSGAAAVPTEWLAGSPFRDYFVPSLILLFIVGGSTAAAAVGLLTRRRWGPTASVAAGGIVLIWIATQLIILGYVSWMQPLIGVIGIATVSLAWREVRI